MPTLEDAVILAAWAHKGQTERSGRPYIGHPLRLLAQMTTATEMMVAVLHDVIEDTAYTLDDLRKAGYPAEVVEAVDHLTRREGESYEDFIQRIKPHPLAVRVKLADLRDNMNILRLVEVSEDDAARLNRYRAAWRELTGE